MAQKRKGGIPGTHISLFPGARLDELAGFAGSRQVLIMDQIRSGRDLLEEAGLKGIGQMKTRTGTGECPGKG